MKQPVYKYIFNIRVEIDKYQWKVLLLNIFLFQLILVTKKGKSGFYSYISDENEQYKCDSRACIFHLLKTLFDLGILVSGMSKVW